MASKAGIPESGTAVSAAIRKTIQPISLLNALDADSEGMEGRFYVWTDEELQAALGDDYSFACAVFHTKKEGNWEHGYNILHKRKSPAEITADLQISGEHYFETLQRVRQKLFQAQEQRERPGLDDKIITAWNGLMLSALADAGFYLNRPDYTAKAERLADFLLQYCRKGSGLSRTYRREGPVINGFLEDYACVIAGLLRLYETTGKERYAMEARLLMDDTIQHFYDPERNIFFFTSAKDQALLVRKTDLSDDVIDSANSMLARSLRKLGFLFVQEDYLEKSSRMLDAVRGQLQKYPGWYSGWAQLALMEAYQTIQLEVCGPDALLLMEQMKKHLPTCMVSAFATHTSALPILQEKVTAQNRIYLCRNRECLEPLHTAEQALEVLEDLWG